MNRRAFLLGALAAPVAVALPAPAEDRFFDGGPALHRGEAILHRGENVISRSEVNRMSREGVEENGGTVDEHGVVSFPCSRVVRVRRGPGDSLVLDRETYMRPWGRVA